MNWIDNFSFAGFLIFQRCHRVAEILFLTKKRKSFLHLPLSLLKGKILRRKNVFFTVTGLNKQPKIYPPVFIEKCCLIFTISSTSWLLFLHGDWSLLFSILLYCFTNRNTKGVFGKGFGFDTVDGVKKKKKK
jgi:hypothetical protein